jgi:hypothetical protein
MKRPQETEPNAAIQDEIDALYRMRPGEFIPARNALAARLKKSGNEAEAQQVKSLSKPSVSAWAVNQLYWKHQDVFHRFIAAGEQFAQASQLRTTPADIREVLARRRQALSDLSHLAAALLREAGHSPTTETMRRVGSTLERCRAVRLLTHHLRDA